MVVDGGLEQVLYLATATPHVAASLFHQAFGSSPAVADSATGMGLYYLGQRTKGVIAKNQPSPDVLSRWMVIGLADGLLTHEWYGFLENYMRSFGLGGLTEAAAMTALTTLLYTPMYCAGFLSGLSLLEGKGVRGAADKLRRDWATMTKTTVATWTPVNFALFAL
eukprot:3119245-Rhodomonas_salina.1